MSAVSKNHLPELPKAAHAMLNRLQSERSKLEGKVASIDRSIKSLTRLTHPGVQKSLGHIALHGTLAELKHNLLHSPNINARDKNGMTALLLAVYRDGNDGAGCSAAQLARQHDHRAIAGVLGHSAQSSS